jgi:RNA polymerase sigma-70 factor (ECF subfamily)
MNSTCDETEDTMAKLDRSAPQLAMEAHAVDVELVELSRAGDAAAYARLYSRYRGVVFATCFRRLGDAHLAEDATQETFMRAFTHIDSFLLEKSFLRWLLTIATRTCVDMHRRRRRVVVLDDVEEATPASAAWRNYADLTADAVQRDQDRLELHQMLATLPPRQRRALMLYAVEGWSYPDIALAEGASVLSVKSLIFRARTKLREASRAGVLGSVLFPLRRLTRAGDSVRERSRINAARFMDPVFMTAAVQPVYAALTALMLFVTSVAAGGLLGVQERDARKIQASSSVDTHSNAKGTLASTRGTRAKAGTQDSRISATTTVDAARRQLLNPTEDATPEDSSFSSIVVSPGFGRDRTAFALGTFTCQRRSCQVLFVTRDGGRSWEKLAALGLSGDTLVLPPNYPSDPRIFAMGPVGLQESDDGGLTFTVKNPLTGDVAISPLFNSGDPRILIGARAILEYWPNQAVIKPAALSASSPVGTSISFSPSYASDRLILLGGAQPKVGGQVYASTVWRCDTSLCSSTTLGGGVGKVSIRTSPTFGADDIVFAFGGRNLYRSRDGARTFEKASLESLGTVSDLVIGSGGRQILAALRGDSKNLFRSSDSGRTWIPVELAVPGFERGTRSLARSTQGGRVFAAGITGIACSVDGGRTWATRC